jgi:alpha-glucosidase
VDVPLDFLDQGRSYTAQIYRDGPDAHWKTNPYSIVTEQREVTRNDTIRLKLAAGGGTAIRFKAGGFE